MSGDPSESIDDQVLAIRILDRDEGALRIFLEIHAGTVKGCLRRRYGHNLQDGEINEAFNSAVLKLWNKIGQFDDRRGTLAGWFLRIAQREAMTIVTREKAHRAANPLVAPDADPAGECEEPEEDEGRDQRREKRISDLRQVIDALPPKQKAIIEADLVGGEAAGAERLATQLETSKASIYVLRNKARATIKSEMQKRGHYTDREGR